MTSDFPTPAELVDQVRAGRRIVHISPRLVEARKALHEVAAAAEPLQPSERIYTASGNERCTNRVSGGIVVFTSIASQRALGLGRIDLVLLDVTPDVVLTDRTLENLVGLLACGATLVRR